MKRIHFDYIKQATEIPRLFLAGLFKNKEIKNPKKILIINTALIGDIAVSFQAIRQFIKNHKDAKIDLIVSSPVKSLAEKIRGINKIYSTMSISNRKIETKISAKEKKEIVNNKYDLIIILRLSKEAYKLLKKIKHKAITTTFKSYLSYVRHISSKNTIEPVKQVRKFFFEALNEKFVNIGFNEIFNFSEKDYKKIKKMPVMKGKEKKIIIHTGSGWKLKHWENEKWAELLRKINRLGKFKFVFVGGEKQEEDDFNIIQRKLNFKVHSIIRKVNLAELLLIMRLSDYFIGIDSGPRNMTYLANLKSIGLVGPGPRIYMPYNTRDIIINKSNCKCTASFCLKRETCMQKIKVSDVFKAFKKMTGKK